MDKPILIFRTRKNGSYEDMKILRENLIKQMNEGFILIPEWIDLHIVQPCNEQFIVEKAFE